MTAEPVIRRLTGPEVGTLVGWAAAEGWNPGCDDAAAFRAADPGGFLGVFTDGVLASAIAAVRYEPDFGFIGLYICRPEQRGKGLGKTAWDAGVARLASRGVGLDGVVAQQANYARAGFVLAHRNTRYEGPAPDPGARPDELSGAAVVELDADPPPGLVEAILAYDARHFPGRREDFLRTWLEPRHRRTVVLLADGAVVGYGTVRAARSAHKIGPLFADNAYGAARLLAALAAPLNGAHIALDVPEPNAAARRLVEEHGLAPSFETARMYRGAVAPLPLHRIFGITSFELG